MPPSAAKPAKKDSDDQGIRRIGEEGGGEGYRKQGARRVTEARIQTGGDGLYILDNRTGQVAVFTYDPASRGVRARKVRNVADAFMTR